MKVIGKLAEWSQWCVTIPPAVIDTRTYRLQYIYKVDSGIKKIKIKTPSKKIPSKKTYLGTKIGRQYSLYARWLIFTVVEISYE
jgi:hypothetical protein